jgi:hypothetical protein
MIFNIVNGTNKGRAKTISVTDLVNFYPEIEVAEKSKYLKALIGCPGYRWIATALDSGAGRGGYPTSNDRAFFVIKNKLFEMSSEESLTERGTLLTSTGMCNFADNGTQMIIVDGVNGYVFNMNTNVLSPIVFPDNFAPSHVVFTDGYFLVNRTGSGRFYYSASYDGTSWNALHFATAEYSPDNLQGIVKTSNGTIWLIGKQSVELWSNVGTAELPWRRIGGSQKEVGCIAPYSIASNGSQVFFLGNSSSGYGAVYMGSGYDVQKISTPAIEYMIKQYANIDMADAFVYSDEGHSFYVISFHNEDTLVFDLASGEWHRRGTYNSGSGSNVRQTARGYLFFNGRHYVGSYTDGSIYEMSLDVYAESGSHIVREIVTNHINNENKILHHLTFELDFERGIGLVGEAAPQIMLQFSNDEGHTWSGEAWVDAAKSAGAIGEYTVRAKWRRLGAARNRVYKITCSDPVKWVIVNSIIEVQ